MKFGFFDDKKREYVITTPKTPYPWINYLGSEEFFSLISNTGGGYSFYRDARLRRITRYRYNDIPRDTNGKYFYINDGGDVWTPGWMPVKKELDSYECRHGMGYTTITGARNGLEVSTCYFVPLGQDAEIHRVKVKNSGKEKKSFKLFSYVEWCLWNAQDDMTNFQRNLSTGEVEIDGGVIYHKTEYRERRDHYAFYSVNAQPTGFDSDRDTFVGMHNGLEAPDAVVNGKSFNSVADGWSPIASHSFDMKLAPGEEKELIFVLGYIVNPIENKWEKPGVINKEKARKMIDNYSTGEAVDKAFNELGAYWDKLLNKYSVHSGDERLDRMVNIWNQYQCMVTFNMSRSASYFESGIGRGMGFRDSNQDLLGFVHQIPHRARERILDIAATQFEDGGAYHQYQPLTKRGNNEIGSNFNDDPLWLILAVTAYIKETGDRSILDEQVPFDNDPNNTATLLEHLKRSFYHVVDNRGPHKLPLIGRADWNDCLNLNCFSMNPDDSFQTCTNKEGKNAESVMIAGMFVFIGREYVALCRELGMGEEADKAEKHIGEMIEAVKKYGWDGQWYLRAYDDGGNKVGSSECDEGKILIESQGFCSMAQIGKDEGYPIKALDSVKEHLDTEHGMVLIEPPYSQYHIELGEISSYPPGYKENGGIFCHNNPWVTIGEAIAGRGDRAYESYAKIAPAFREEISEVHRMEPYVYSQMIAGKAAKRHGEAKNSWLTGTASWNFVAITQWILGIHPDYNGLRIDPRIPARWDGFTVNRVFRGTTYKVTVQNPDHVSSGIKQVSVNGKTIEGNVVPVGKEGETVEVTVLMG